MSYFADELQKACVERGIDPCPETFLTSLGSDGVLTLENYTVQPRQAAALSCALRACPNAYTTVLLNNLFLGEEGLKEVCLALRTSPTLRVLSLCGHGLRDEHRGISDLLSGAPALEVLSLEWNKLGVSPHAMQSISNAVMRHGKLSTLNISNNMLTPDGVRELSSEVLRRESSSLVSLDLSWNRLGNIGATMLLDGLALNTTLSQISLKGNSIDQSLLDRLRERTQANEQRRREAEQRATMQSAAQAAMTTLQEKEAVLTNSVAEREAKIRELEAALSQSREETRSALKDAEALRLRHEDTRKKQDETESFYTHRESVLLRDKQTLVDQVESMKGHITQLQEDLTRSQAQTRSLEDARHRDQAAHETALSDVKRENRETHSRIEALLVSQRQGNEDLEATCSKLQELRQEMLSKDARNTHMEEEVRRLTTDMKSRDAHVTMLESRNLALQTQLGEAQDKVHKCEEEKNVLRGDLTRREVEVRERYSREKVDLEATWGSRLRDAEDALRVKNLLVGDLEKELEAVRERSERTLKGVEELRKTDSEANAKAQIEVQRVQHNVSELQSDKRRLEHSLQMAEARATTLSNEISDLQRQHQTRIEELTGYHTLKLRELEDRLNAKSNAISDAERERNKALEEARKMKEERRRLHEIVENKVSEAVHAALADLRCD